MLLLAGDARCQYRATDLLVQNLACNLGFQDHDLVCLRIAVRGRSITLVIVPRRLWHSEAPRAALLQLKELAGRVGNRVLLVPEPQLRKKQRSENALAVVAAAGTAVSTEQRFNLEVTLMAHAEGLPLKDCANLLDGHLDPINAVLCLVYCGRIYLSLNQPLSPNSIVRSIQHPVVRSPMTHLHCKI